jgi:hypothetical protein
MKKAKHICVLFFFFSVFYLPGNSQVIKDAASHVLFHGVVMDALTLTPVDNSQILINRTLRSVTGKSGKFSFYVNKKDTVVFTSMGYKPATMIISDTLSKNEFIAGIYLSNDTLEIPEVVILPRYTNIRSEILNAKSKVPSTMANARYNLALSAYQARNSQGRMDDPASNYAYLHQRQKIEAMEKGGIPSDQIAGINPLILIPGLYMLIHGMPEKPSPMRSEISSYEIDQINRAYLRLLEKEK